MLVIILDKIEKKKSGIENVFKTQKNRPKTIAET